MKRLLAPWVLAVAALAVLPSLAQAHFLWLLPVTADNKTTVELYFSEGPEPDEAELLKKLGTVKGWSQAGNKAEAAKFEFTLGKDALVSPAVTATTPTAVGLTHNYGLLERGNSAFLLNYYATTFVGGTLTDWLKYGATGQQPLEVVPSEVEGQLQINVLWQGKPLPGAQVMFATAGGAEQELTTNDQGIVRVKLPAADVVTTVRARHMEATPGEVDGKKYTGVRHYSTVVLPGTAKK